MGPRTPSAIGALATAACAAAFVPMAATAFDCSGISAAAHTPLESVRVASGLLRPLFVTAPPSDPSRVLIVQQDGLVRLLKDGVLQGTAFLDVGALTRSPADGGGNEEGLLGMAFHPDYAANGFFFVYHTDATGANNLVVRYGRMASDPDRADPGSRQIVLTIPHTSASIHNGGMILFGPADGHLYVATGDGGVFCDSVGNAQRLDVNLGKLLRIDVDALPYAIPPDNPFAGGGGNGEIWALGLLNPWRFSIDPASGDLYVGDVGQSNREEISYVPGTSAGRENYGWPHYEGSLCPNPTCAALPCALPALVLPIHEYGHGAGVCAVTGGYVYRGCRMPGLHGTYFYADYCAAFVRTFRVAGGAAADHDDVTAELDPGGGTSIGAVTSFGQDARGELYVVDRGMAGGGGTGEVFKIVPAFVNLEVSGPGAEPLAAGDPDWTWEDLTLTSSHPVAAYRVYRNAAGGAGPFDCVRQAPAPVWAGGDLAAPAAGGIFAYIVTAIDASGRETSPGASTGGSPRVLSAALCPP
jgi:glucose/arabinose dehydrogenase